MPGLGDRYAPVPRIGERRSQPQPGVASGRAGFRLRPCRVSLQGVSGVDAGRAPGVAARVVPPSRARLRPGRASASPRPRPGRAPAVIVPDQVLSASQVKVAVSVWPATVFSYLRQA